VPYDIVGAVEFYERKEVKDLLAYLRVLVNPLDAVSFLRIVNVPTRGLGKAGLERLRAWAVPEGLSPREAARRAGACAIPEISGKSRAALRTAHGPARRPAGHALRAAGGDLPRGRAAHRLSRVPARLGRAGRRRPHRQRRRAGGRTGGLRARGDGALDRRLPAGHGALSDADLTTPTPTA
jgi:superfamily I DNA/RNA helicase